MPTDFWIQTYTGGKFSLSQPCVEDVRFDDVCASLSHMCRYTGHCLPFYSVAQHCVHVSELVPRRDMGAALVHDFAESVIGDWSSPMKAWLRELCGNAWAIIECRVREIEQTFASAFRVGYPWPDSVKLADRKMMATEKRDLMLPEPFDWPAMPSPRVEPVDPWDAETSAWKLRKRYAELKRKGLIA